MRWHADEFAATPGSDRLREQRGLTHVREHQGIQRLLGVHARAATRSFIASLLGHSTGGRLGIAPALRGAGFTGSGTSYVLPSAMHWAMIGFQGSMANTSQRMKFTVNCKVVRKDVWASVYAERPYIGARPKPNVGAGNFEWWERIGSLMPAGHDHWWWLSPDDDLVAVAHDVVDALTRCAPPAMRKEIARTG